MQGYIKTLECIYISSTLSSARPLETLSHYQNTVIVSNPWWNVEGVSLKLATADSDNGSTFMANVEESHGETVGIPIE